MRPERLRLPDFAGRLISLDDSPGSWRKLKEGDRGRLLLGLGPTPGKAPVRAPLAWCEAPQTLELLQAHKGGCPLPADWQQIESAQLPGYIKDYEVWFYYPGLKLAPDFWSPILAAIALVNSPSVKPAANLVWLPGDSRQLLHQDLLAELVSAGFHVCQATPEKPDPESLLQIWSGHSPSFILSINFRGLDPEGRIFGICQALDIPVAIWLVDNPWNILSGVTLPWWKQASLFTTDASFVQPLQAAGAKNTFFLPLAASPFMRGKYAPLSGRTPPVFVGSSTFRDHKKFFSGLKINSSLHEQALAKLATGDLPDFHWWQEQLKARLWPGREFRAASLGCAECSASRRSRWLAEALQSGLEIIGDGGWKTRLPGAPLRAPVDYYAQLPHIYARSECVLNITSLLLPHSLNQRHFDVWAAGGFLLTDATPGLDIFPEELTKPIALGAPAEFGAKLAWLRAHPDAKQDLAGAWRELIAKSHTYANRLEELCNRLNVPWPAARRGK